MTLPLGFIGLTGEDPAAWDPLYCENCGALVGDEYTYGPVQPCHACGRDPSTGAEWPAGEPCAE